uniref:RNA polymerase alpha subunit n=1 Tax=Euglena viridis TaxID=3040 RepID=M1EV53_EUGVI|nr:RNA polymerase alpha subunit [Euglena viridis]AEY70823.2 RNA polymerase alpha subunit [Euglena viridis]
MKIIRISILKNKFVVNECYGLLKIYLFGDKELNFLGNFIRRSLLKDFSGLRVGELAFFISNNYKKSFPIYQRIHEFLNLEEIAESLSQTYLNFKDIDIRVRDKFIFNDKFGILKASGINSFFSQDIIFSKDVTIIRPSHFLFSLLSSKINLKVILKIEV